MAGRRLESRTQDERLLWRILHTWVILWAVWRRHAPLGTLFATSPAEASMQVGTVDPGCRPC
jgi:hypothetical protein